jgi:hypothetical protein
VTPRTMAIIGLSMLAIAQLACKVSAWRECRASHSFIYCASVMR